MKQLAVENAAEVVAYRGGSRAPRQIVCVVIPIYSAHLKPSERVALDRCITTLNGYPLTFAKPVALDIGLLTDRYPQVHCESFSNEFFNGIQGYNRMMLSDEFYARFANYEFILVHQLDAFVFSDQLLQWCTRDYDYVGAPWLPKGNAPSVGHRSWLAMRRKWYRLFDVHNRHSGLTHDVQLRYSVGNGGFSLRRVACMRRVLTELSGRVESYRSTTRSSWGEDLFFSIEANRYRRRVKLPSVAEAAHFAWETNLKAAAQLTAGKLPFGCHAWDKHIDEWQPIFSKLGYSVAELLEP